MSILIRLLKFSPNSCSCNFHSSVVFNNKHFNFPLIFCHLFWNSHQKNHWWKIFTVYLYTVCEHTLHRVWVYLYTVCEYTSIVFVSIPLHYVRVYLYTVREYTCILCVSNTIPYTVLSIPYTVSDYTCILCVGIPVHCVRVYLYTVSVYLHTVCEFIFNVPSKI